MNTNTNPGDSGITNQAKPAEHVGAETPRQKRGPEISPGFRDASTTKASNRICKVTSISLTPEMLAAVQARVRELGTTVSSKSHYLQRLIEIDLQRDLLSSPHPPHELENQPPPPAPSAPRLGASRKLATRSSANIFENQVTAERARHLLTDCRECDRCSGRGCDRCGNTGWIGKPMSPMRMSAIKKQMGIPGRHVFLSQVRQFLRDNPTFKITTAYPKRPRAGQNPTAKPT